MEEEYSAVDTSQLLEAASEFALYPGAQSNDSVVQFLDRFPLPVLINALQTKADVPGLENAVVDSLERIFGTKYGASYIPHYMPFIAVGLGSDSHKVQRLACKAVSCLLEHVDETSVSAAQLVIEHDVYPLLLKCLIEGDEQVARASMDAITNLASSPKGMDIIFPADNNERTHLKDLAGRCSSLGRVRIFALIVKLFSVSNSVASVVYESKLLSLLVEEVSNANDTLVTLSVLELLYELAVIQYSMEFLSRTNLIQLLNSVISNTSADSILRSRAMMISGRLLSKESTFSFIDESGVQTTISAIDERLQLLDSKDVDECECALEALGQIGSSIRGAELLLLSSPPVARHVVRAAFDPHGRGMQLAALHALGNISGVNRQETNIMLGDDAEKSLRHLIYEMASQSSKLTPSGLILYILQQKSEIRLAGYRLLTPLVSRSWCLVEIISREEIINIVSDPYTETAKIGMEARHNCCQAIHKALTSSSKLASDAALAGISAKLSEAVRKGPYLARKHPEVQPLVMTAERF